MSYTHIHLPEKSKLEEILLDNPSEIKYYAKYGSLIGPTESVKYLNEKINEYFRT